MAGRLEKLKLAYEKADSATGGRLELFRGTYLRFLELRGPEAAAALAYYALFSLFPLMLFLVSILGFLLSSSERAYYQTLMFVRTALPVSRRLIEENLNQIYQHRGSLGAVGLLWLLWSSSGFFNVLGRNINLAWPSVRLRNVMQSRLVAVAMVGGLFILLLLSLISTSVVEALPSIMALFQINPSFLSSPVWLTVLWLVPGTFSFILFMALYLWVPNKPVHFGAAWRGALGATLAWELAKRLFSTYVGSGLNNYEFLYGSLGALTALLFWIFLSSLIVLLGAHFVAAMDMQADLKSEEKAVQVSDKAVKTPSHEDQEVPDSDNDKKEPVPARGFGIDDPARRKPVTEVSEERN